LRLPPSSDPLPAATQYDAGAGKQSAEARAAQERCEEVADLGGVRLDNPDLQTETNGRSSAGKRDAEYVKPLAGRLQRVAFSCSGVVFF
jgi:hypothetical protein